MAATAITPRPSQGARLFACLPACFHAATRCMGRVPVNTDDDANFQTETSILDYVERHAHRQVEEFKRRYFGSHPDDPVILHRKELVNQKPPFEALRDPAARERFDTELLELLADLDYTVFTTVIDKLEHKRRYSVWRYDPYNYCLHMILERYVMWLERRKVRET
jgi:hypothetical protein